MANCEDSYAETMGKMQAEARALSEKYEAAHPDCTPKFKSFSTGYRSLGWVSNSTFKFYPACERCGGKDIGSDSIVAGCRMNGDGYGTFVTWCKTCGLLDVKSYDEA